MCFSATASFIAAGVLCVAGIIAVRISKSHSYFMLACTPFLFAIQQAAEGISWVTRSTQHLSFSHYLSTHIFLIFAFLVWPIWIPSALLMTEENDGRRKILWALIVLGILLSAFDILLLLHYINVTTIFSDHVKYQVGYPITYLFTLHLFVYACATVLPFFIASIKLSKWFGLLLFTSLLFSYFFMIETFTSVWCFFAAVLSIFVIIVIKKNQSPTR